MDEVRLNGMSALEAFKYFLLRERKRHLDDVAQIDADLVWLADIDVKADICDLDAWIKISR